MTGLKVIAAVAVPTLAVEAALATAVLTQIAHIESALATAVLTQIAHIEVDTAKLVGWVAGTGFALLGLALRTIWNDRDEKIRKMKETLHALKNTVQGLEFRVKALEEKEEARRPRRQE